MDFSELRAVVEHLVKSGLKPKDVLTELEKVHCNRVPFYSTITGQWIMTGISKSTIHRIMTEILGMNKVSSY